MRTRAKQLLKQAYGPTTRFRPGQWEAIEALVERRQRLLVVQRTGWGKSMVYFLATRLLREAGRGPTLIISPLLSLMRNQLQAADKLGLTSATMNSTNREDWDAVKQQLQEDAIDLLLLSPEHLGSEHFATSVRPTIQGGIGLLVVDEAHCISDWGHDFRPDYRRIVRVVQELPRNIPLLGTTATANARVVADVQAQLGPDLHLQRGPLTRKSLRLQTIQLADQAERLAWLAENLPHLPGSGIIYCLTIADAERVSAWLHLHGIDAPAYHAKVDDRPALEERLLNNQCKALVATVALGMGFDKPDLGFVVHYQRPGSVVAYYQQVGRAGRAVDTADAILLNGREDDEIQEYFIASAFPSERATEDVVHLLEETDGLSKPAILQQLNLRDGQLDRILKLLQIDGVIGKERTTYFRTTHPFVPDRAHQKQVTRQRRQELERMRAFVTHDGCLMAFIARELDDPDAAPCGRCANCAGDLAPRTVSDAMTRKAIAFLQREHRPIEPRRQWPPGGSGGRSGRIPEANRVEPGLALCMYGDAGWGRLVRTGKYEAHRFDDDLVDAVARMVAADWRPEPQPTWVTAVPSLRRPDLVPDFARRLADRLGLPFRPVIAKIEDTPPQKEMQNSAQQARNAINAFALTGRIPDGPVLLVDDIVDSRWTLTVCGVLLREAGSGPVFPVALATAAGGGSDSE